MKRTFDITFDFSLSSSDFVVRLRAKAEEHHSIEYYVVTDFHPVNAAINSKQPSSLPRQEIRRMKNSNGHSWVHCDSGKETMLSIAIGKAIDELTGTG